ncbi:MAG: ABC-2 family transporter protein [Rhizobiales bacterium]|nr:ABC-2 family transporter protein [Hyphomicrobiales bacterium]
MRYLAFTASAFQTRLAYRGQVWAQILGELVTVFAKIAIWVSIYSGIASVDGITRADMLTYAILGGTLLGAWEWPQLVNTISTQIKTGDVAVFLLKPLHYPVMLLHSEIGNLGFKFSMVVVPVVIITSSVYGLLPPASVFHGAMFVAYWLLSFSLLFCLSAIAGLLAFWLMTAFSLEWLLRSLISILSGAFIPLWFFPENIAAIIKFLPFAWIGFHPTAVYLGKMDVGQTLLYFLIGLGWMLFLVSIVTLLWRRAAQRIVVQGG